MIHYQKPSDLDLHHFQKSVYNFEEAMHIVHLFGRILFVLKAKLFKNVEHFPLSIFKEIVGLQGWNLQNASQSSKQGIP